MYISPINIIYGRIDTLIEHDILQVVLSYDIKVNKEELEAALRYDRNQYEKGYRDGYSKGKDAVVHGRWDVKCDSHLDYASGEFDEDYYIECSECGRKVWDISQDAALFGDWEKIFNKYPYCHCGAKMDGGQNDE